MAAYFAAALGPVPDYVQRAGPKVDHRVVAVGPHKFEPSEGLVFGMQRFLADHPDFLFKEAFDTGMFDRVSVELALATGNAAARKVMRPKRPAAAGYHEPTGEFATQCVAVGAQLSCAPILGQLHYADTLIWVPCCR